ncbi:MAG: HAD family hydrolase [Candidatus Hodarchaeota archaeon]
MSPSNIAISAIIFDAGDVLVHQIPDEDLEVMTTFYSRYSGYDKSELSFHFTQLYEKIRTLKPNSKINFVEMKLDNQPKLKLPISLFCEYEVEKFWKNPDPLLKETFIYLRKQGYRIAILTDSALPSDKIRKILNHVSPYIHSIVSSRDIGTMKPDQSMYSAILKRLNISAKKGLFIGHDIEEIQGASEVGLFHENYEEIGSLERLIEVIHQKYVFYE